MKACCKSNTILARSTFILEEDSLSALEKGSIGQSVNSRPENKKLSEIRLFQPIRDNDFLLNDRLDTWIL